MRKQKENGFGWVPLMAFNNTQRHVDIRTDTHTVTCRHTNTYKQTQLLSYPTLIKLSEMNSHNVSVKIKFLSSEAQVSHRGRCSGVFPVHRWTYSISGADSLIVNPITFMRQQRSIPVSIVGPVVTCTHKTQKWTKRLTEWLSVRLSVWLTVWLTHTEGRGHSQLTWRQLGTEVILWVQQCCVLEVDWNWITAQDLCATSP